MAMSTKQTEIDLQVVGQQKTVSPFQTLNCISTEKNQTVVFPLPIDLVDGLLGTKGKEVLEADEDTAEAQLLAEVVEGGKTFDSFHIINAKMNSNKQKRCTGR